MIQSSTFMGIRELLSPGKPIRTAWTIYDIIMPPIVFGWIFGMIVAGVVGELFKRARSVPSAHPLPR